MSNSEYRTPEAPTDGVHCIPCAVLDALPASALVLRTAGTEAEILQVNGRLVQFANAMHAHTTGEPGTWDAPGLHSAFRQDLYFFVAPEDRPIVRAMIAEAAESGFSRRVFRLSGTEGDSAVCISALCSCRRQEDGGRIYYVLFDDCTTQITYRRQLESKQQELERISRYDALTGLRNRAAYNRYLDDSRSAVKRGTGVIFCNLNGLKASNAEYGTLFGDNLIVSYANTLLRYFDREQIFRISGDEFVVVQEDVAAEEFEARAAQLLSETAADGVAAVGVKWTASTSNLKRVIDQTEQLMMIQKQKYYISSAERSSRHRPRHLNTLMAELRQKRYSVYLQPKAALGSTRVVGAEALVRKTDPAGRIIPPSEFVPMLERELLISNLDFFVLEEVCKLLTQWRKEGRRLIKISVNMSRVSIMEQDFIAHIQSLCGGYQIDPQYLEFEVTESSETRDDRQLLENVTRLHDLGYGVSLDDMGSDYSSIKMLTMQGVDTVKIDRGLTLQIHRKEGAALIRYIIALCHEIGKRCIAEGVESLSTAVTLHDMGCDYYQGYLLNRPIPVRQFESYLIA
jgi:diguanylate cyclase (GGDEF)-like protein